MEIDVRLQRFDVLFPIIYPDSDNELRPVQERRILYQILLITKGLGELNSP